MASLHEQQHGSHIEDDSSDGIAPRPFLPRPRPAPRTAESFHMETPKDVASRHIPLFEVAKHEEDDDDDDEDEALLPAAAQHRDDHHEPAIGTSAPVGHGDAPTFEVPLDVPAMHEFVEPQPLPPLESSLPTPHEALETNETDEEDEDDVPAKPVNLFARREPTPPAAETPMVFGPETPAAEIPPAPTPEAIVLAAAEQTVETATPEPSEVRVAAPAPGSPANHNAPPASPNILPPAPPPSNVPPAAHGGGNFAPPPPNYGGGAGGDNHDFYNRMPPNNGPHLFNAAPNVITHVVERERTVEVGGGNVLAVLAIIGLLRERSKRKRGDAELGKKIKAYQKRFEDQAQEQTRQSERLRQQSRELDQANQNVADLTTTVERQRAETTAAAWAASTAERPVPKPAEQIIKPSAETAPEATEIDPFANQTEQRVRYDAWLGTRMRKEAATGREIVDTDAQYGQAYHQERRAETGAAAALSDAASPAGSAGQPLATPQSIGVPLPGASNPSLPTGMTNPALPPDARPLYNDPQHLLPAPTHPVRNTFTTVFLWIIVAALAFAAASAIRLFF